MGRFVSRNRFTQALILCIFSLLYSYPFVQAQDAQNPFFGALTPEAQTTYTHAKNCYNNFLKELRSQGTAYKTTAPESQNTTSLAHIKQLKPIIEKAYTTIREAKATFDEKIALLQPADSLYQAYVSTNRELELYCDILEIFSQLHHNATKIAPHTHHLFKIVSWVFDFYDNLSIFYKKDHGNRFLQITILNAGLRTALAAWSMSLHQSDQSALLLSRALQGDLAITPQSNLLISIASIIPACFVFCYPSILSNPAHIIFKGFGQMAAAFLYYVLCDVKIPLDTQADNYFFNALNKTQQAIFNELARRIRLHLNPQTVEGLEKYTMGIIKPELLGECFEALFPCAIIAYKTNLARENKDYFFNLLSDKKFEKIESYSKNGNIVANYIEFRIISYLCSSLGQFWGRTLSGKYQKQIHAATSVCIDTTIATCAKLGIISKESAELIKELKNEIGNQFDEFANSLGNGLKFLLSQEVTLEPSQGGKQLLHYVLTHLAAMRFLSYLEAASIEQAFAQNPTAINTLIDDMIQTIKHNITATIGGLIGAKIALLIGRGVMHAHGPFFTGSTS